MICWAQHNIGVHRLINLRRRMKATCITPPTQFWSVSKPSVFPRLLSIPCNSSSSSSSTSNSINFNIPLENKKQKNQNIIIVKNDADADAAIEEVTTFPSMSPRLSLSDQAFFLLTFIACTTLASFTGFVMAAVPTLYMVKVSSLLEPKNVIALVLALLLETTEDYLQYVLASAGIDSSNAFKAMSRTAIAFAKLADTAREELPSTMAAIRLSGMEISDLTLELSDLSQEISDGVTKSAQAVQAAEAGVRQIGSLARHKTMAMIEERANLPEISIQPVVAGVAKKTSQALGHAGKTFMNMVSGADSSLEDERPSTHIDTLP